MSTKTSRAPARMPRPLRDDGPRTTARRTRCVFRRSQSASLQPAPRRQGAAALSCGVSFRRPASRHHPIGVDRLGSLERGIGPPERVDDEWASALREPQPSMSTRRSAARRALSAPRRPRHFSSRRTRALRTRRSRRAGRCRGSDTPPSPWPARRAYRTRRTRGRRRSPDRAETPAATGAPWWTTELREPRRHVPARQPSLAQFADEQCRVTLTDARPR